MNRYELEFTRVQLSQISDRLNNLAGIAEAAANPKRAGRIWDVQSEVEQALLNLDYLDAEMEERA
jgi:hypothetical protein